LRSLGRWMANVGDVISGIASGSPQRGSADE
jgi:hypothetical protein